MMVPPPPPPQLLVPVGIEQVRSYDDWTDDGKMEVLAGLHVLGTPEEQRLDKGSEEEQEVQQSPEPPLIADEGSVTHMSRMLPVGTWRLSLPPEVCTTRMLPPPGMEIRQP